LVNSTVFSGALSFSTKPYVLGTDLILNPAYIFLSNASFIIDELMMFNYALSSSEVSILYNGYNSSMTINYYDADTKNVITKYVTATLSNDAFEQTYSSLTGSIFFNDLATGQYSLLSKCDGYLASQLILNLAANQHGNISVYLVNSTNGETTIFTIKNRDSGGIIPNALVQIYKYSGSAPQLINSVYSDISGKVKFNYLPDTKYSFNVSASGYSDKIFSLNPILFSEYDIWLTTGIAINFSVDFESLILGLSPDAYYNNTDNVFLFNVSSPNGTLINYGYNITYPGGTQSNSGTNHYGELLTSTINVNSTYPADNVIVDYYYTSILAGTRSYRQIYPIIQNQSHTLSNIKDNNYGMGIFEIILFVTLGMVLITGVCALFGQPIFGFTLALFFLAFCIKIKFIPFWVGVPTIVAGFFFILWKSGGSD
jgi:hypothetical protein